jgi:CHAD domain-containing protein
VATEHLEIERKLDVDQSFALPDLGGIDGVATVDDPVAHDLEATYHDTADLRLARARITLRRRTGGTDAGWHLKLPATDGARRELHQPLGRAVRKPPRGLLGPVTGVLRGAPLGPVATLQTRRQVTVLRDTDGRALAEVADDAVTATALAAGPGEPSDVHGWREVEVELLAGDEALLAALVDRLEVAGARPAGTLSKAGRVLAARLERQQPSPTRAGTGKPRAGDVVLSAVAAQVAALQAADVDVRTDQPDAVHQVRVASRRLRSILASFRPVLDVERTEPLRAELRWLARRLAEARDGEVVLAHLREVVAAEPEELVLGPVAARLQQTQVQEEQAGRERALETLVEDRYLRLLDDLHGLLADPPLTPRAAGPARPLMRTALRRSARRLARRIEAADRVIGTDREAALHDVRRAAKRVRYTAEVARPLLGRRVKALERCMEQVQDVLGGQQDSVVARDYCRRIGLAAAAAGENAWTYGRLHGLEQLRAARSDAAFRELEPAVRKVVRAATARR